MKFSYIEVECFKCYNIYNKSIQNYKLKIVKLKLVMINYGKY